MAVSLFSICRKSGPKAIAVIETKAISNMIAHHDGIYIYGKRYYREYDSLAPEEYDAFCIKADRIQIRTFSYEDAQLFAEISGAPLILHDTSVYVGKPDCIFRS